MTTLDLPLRQDGRPRRGALAGALLVHAALLGAGLFALQHRAPHEQVFGDSVAVTLVASAPGGGQQASTASDAASRQSRMMQELDAANIPPGATEPAAAAAPSSLSDVLDGGGAPKGDASGRDGGAASGGAYGFDDPYAHVSLYRDKAAPTGQVVRNQVARCWRAQPGLPAIVLRVRLDASGVVRGEPKVVGAAKDAAAAEAVERARQAIGACAPYPIPPGDPGPLTFDLRF